MPEILDQPRLDILFVHVEAGDRIAYYTQLAEWGYRYGNLALGLSVMILSQAQPPMNFSPI